MSVTADRLRQLFDYDQSTGDFTRKVQTSNRVKVGQVAGCINSEGYVLIHVDGKRYLAHRLAWLFVTGSMPNNLIDHVNERRADNRWENLRAADNAQNLWNRGASKASARGLKGVSFERRTGRWRASIMARGESVFLGRFSTAEEAHSAYAAAANDFHRQFANAGAAA